MTHNNRGGRLTVALGGAWRLSAEEKQALRDLLRRLIAEQAARKR